MSERLENSGDFDTSPAHQFFLRRKQEIQNEMQQIMHDTLLSQGGQEGVDFITSMGFNLTMSDTSVPTPEMILEIEQFFPGFWPIVREKWQPLMAEGRILSLIEARRARAEQDRLALEPYENEA